VVDVFGGGRNAIEIALTVYTCAAAVLGLALVALLWRVRFELWEQVALLVLAYDVLPQVSGGYKLLHLVVPIAMFLRFGARERLRAVYVACFAVLLIPKAYHLLRPDGTNVGVVIDPLVMTALALLIVASAVSQSRRRLAQGPSGAAQQTAPASG
jgi:ABC-type spermidine/putrescine transport system permease subunit II